MLIFQFFITLYLSYAAHAQVEFVPAKFFNPTFEFENGTKRKLPVVDYGKVKGQDIKIFSIGNGAVSIDLVNEIRNGKWLPKDDKGMWYLKEIRLTCPPLRTTNDEKFKFYSPSRKEVEDGAPLEYQVDVPCNMDQAAFKDQLVKLSNLMKEPFIGESLKCDPHNMSSACKGLDTVTKILSGDFDSGQSYYCGIELNVGSTWDIPIQIDHPKTTSEKVSMLDLVDGVYPSLMNYRTTSEITESQKIAYTEYMDKIKKLMPLLKNWEDQIFANPDPKVTRDLWLLKDGKTYVDIKNKFNEECKWDYECADKLWKKNYNINHPATFSELETKLKSMQGKLEHRDEHKLKDNQYTEYEDGSFKIRNLKKGCSFDKKLVVVICPDP